MISNRILTVAACVLVLCLCIVPVPMVRAASVWIRPPSTNIYVYIANQSDYWDDRNTTQDEWFYTLAGIMMFNESHMNDTIAAIDTASSKWNISDFYLINASGVLTLNESRLNATIAAIAGAGSQWTISDFYLINASGTLTLNESRLNATIAALVGAGAQWTISDFYLINASGTLTLNESRLNDTIDARDDNTQLTQEAVQDYAWSVTGGTQTGITVTYNDAGDNVSFVVTNFSNQALNSTSSPTFVNVTVTGYLHGEPIDGGLGSGIIECDDINEYGNINLTQGTLNVTYPNMIVRLARTDNTVQYCNLSSATINVPDDQHTVFYVDSDCTVKNTTFTTYIDFDLSPGGLTDLFNTFASDGVIEIAKGVTVMNKEALQIRKKIALVDHLTVISGMGMNPNTAFPEVYQNAGKYLYLRTVVDATAQNSSDDDIHVVYHSGGDWVHTAQAGINLSICDDGSDIAACPDNRFRRYIFYTMGYADGTDTTKVHQYVPLTTDTSFSNIGDCEDIQATPISYTLQASSLYVAVPTYAYCGQRDDAAWTGGWIDLRSGVGVSGASIDTSIFLTLDGERPMEGNLNMSGYSLTDLGALVIEGLLTSYNITPATHNLYSIGNSSHWYAEAYITNLTTININSTDINTKRLDSTNISSTNLNSSNIDSDVVVVDNNITIGSNSIKDDSGDIVITLT